MNQTILSLSQSIKSSVESFIPTNELQNLSNSEKAAYALSLAQTNCNFEVIIPAVKETYIQGVKLIINSLKETEVNTANTQEENFARLIAKENSIKEIEMLLNQFCIQQ